MQASTVKQSELDQSIDKLKDPIDDFRMMIEAAVEACLRRRKLVFKYYEQKEQLHLAGVGADTFDQARRELHLQQTKKNEEQYERVKESTKTLDDELRLFRKEKELEMRGILTEFIKLKRQSNDLLRGQWLNFLQRAEGNQ